MFLTLGLKFQVWNLEISFRDWKKYILQCKMYVFPILDLQNIAKTYILHCKIVFFDFQEAPEKSMSF